MLEGSRLSSSESIDRYYILDGHARSLRAGQLGLKSINAMILSPRTLIDFEVVRTAREMDLKNLKDIVIS